MAGKPGNPPGRHRAVTGQPSGAELSAEQIAAHDRQRDLGPEGERQLTAVLAAVFRAGGVVADVGGGTGVAAPFFLAAGLRAVLVDLSWSMLAAGAARLGPRIQGDIGRLPLASGSVDGVYAAYVVQNVRAWRGALAEIRRIIKPDGAVLIAFGAPPADEVYSQLSRHYFGVLTQAGAERTGVAADPG
jgi:ubiquinone/menaquinone biosynthesis C-methylase UbiE